MKGYKESYKVIADSDIGVDMFKKSSILAFIFEKDKDKVLDDMIKYRQEKLRIAKKR